MLNNYNNNNNNITISHSFNSMSSSSIFTQQQQHHHLQDEMVSWTVVKNYITECWLQFYGPLFWIIHLFLCNIELHKSKKHLMDDHHHICQSIIFEENHHHKLNPILTTTTTTTTSLKTTTKMENNDDQTNHNNNQTDIDDDNASSSSNSSIQLSKSSFKNSLKGHLKSIKQKAMKKSILRKSSKQSLMIQQQQQEETLLLSSSSSSSPLSSSLPNSPLSSSTLLLNTKNESTISLPSTTIVYNEEENLNSFNDNKQPVFIPSLDRRPSFSDSLLKSFGKKKKQPSSIPFPMNLQSNHNFNNLTTPTSSSTISFGRRETAPEIYTKIN